MLGWCYIIKPHFFPYYCDVTVAIPFIISLIFFLFLINFFLEMRQAQKPRDVHGCGVRLNADLRTLTLRRT